MAIDGSLIVVGQPELNTSLVGGDHGAASVFLDTGAGVSYEAELMPAEFEPGATPQPGSYAHLVRTLSVPAEVALELH